MTMDRQADGRTCNKIVTANIVWTATKHCQKRNAIWISKAKALYILLKKLSLFLKHIHIHCFITQRLPIKDPYHNFVFITNIVKYVFFSVVNSAKWLKMHRMDAKSGILTYIDFTDQKLYIQTLSSCTITIG